MTVMVVTVRAVALSILASDLAGVSSVPRSAHA